jgi:hypothetical protein
LRSPRARTAAEAEFLALGNGARLWLAEAAAVTTARLTGTAEVDQALGHAAVSARFGEGDLASILDHRARTGTGPDSRAGEDRSLAQGTASWAALGTAADGEVTA